jgi:ComF family protein
MSILPHPDKITDLARKLGEALLPGSCLLCGADSQSQLLCHGCSADLPGLPPNLCPLCADQTTHGERCGACLKDPPYFERTVALFLYDFPLDRIIHALKYGHQLPVAAWCGRQLAKRITKEEFDLIIPLPLHPKRLIERGFNQSVEIARVLGKRSNIDVDLGNVIRTRATPTQADLPHKERKKNVRGAFECRTNLSGQRLLLIDDVMTTGATLNECARTLKLHGAASVTVAVIARALRR